MLSNISHLLYIVLSPLISTVAATLNAFTIYIFTKRFRLSSFTIIVIVNICVCDIFVCLFSNTFYMANLLHAHHNWTTGTIGCKIFKCLTMFTNVAQIFLLCILSTDRLRRLIYFAKAQWTKGDCKKLTLFCWCISAIITFPRLFLFEEKYAKLPVKSGDNNTFETKLVLNCKPVDSIWYTGLAVVTFILAYAIPTCFILFSLIQARLFMWKRRNTIHISCNRNTLTKMNNTLSMTFTLTSFLFVIIWTPFFVLSMIDLKHYLVKRADLIDVNFSMRCTLLALGSLKPIIYIICIEKFRKSFRLQPIGVQTCEASTSSKGRSDETLTRDLKLSGSDQDTGTKLPSRGKYNDDGSNA